MSSMTMISTIVTSVSVVRLSSAACSVSEASGDGPLT